MATLTFVYAEKIAVLGPLSQSPEPHSMDLCADHARKLVVPRGWELVKSDFDLTHTQRPEEDELTAIAEAVRENRENQSGRSPRRASRKTGARAATVVENMVQQARPIKEKFELPPNTTGRRGHLRLLPTITDTQS